MTTSLFSNIFAEFCNRSLAFALRNVDTRFAVGNAEARRPMSGLNVRPNQSAPYAAIQDLFAVNLSIAAIGCMMC